MFTSLTNWFFRLYARGTLDALHGGGGLPTGLNSQDRFVQARVGRVAWRLGRATVVEVLTGSANPLRDLEAMEAFVASVRRIPGDYFDRSFEGQSVSCPGRALSRSRGCRSSPWVVAAPLLQRAVEMARTGGWFELTYRPSKTELRACSLDHDDEFFLVHAAEITLGLIAKPRTEQPDVIPSSSGT
jgi:hypothetical protein